MLVEHPSHVWKCLYDGKGFASSHSAQGGLEIRNTSRLVKFKHDIDDDIACYLVGLFTYINKKAKEKT